MQKLPQFASRIYWNQRCRGILWKNILLHCTRLRLGINISAMETRTCIVLSIKHSGYFKVLEANLRTGLAYGISTRSVASILQETFLLLFTTLRFLGLISFSISCFVKIL